MRIVGGAWRGVVLTAPPGREHRPTQARVREGLFAALGERVSAAEVLDLYAGSGALGLEALSRGAAAVVFVERSAAALEALRQNVARCRAGDRVRIVACDVARFLTGDAGRVTRVSLALADPPYDDDTADLMGRISGSAALEWGAGALIAVEYACRAAEPRTPAGWRAWRVRRYGDSCLAIAERESDE